ncbi:MAG: hypothetical protein BWY85_02332 [Firmicutes bacterium ADurb.Bin506]|nr:MAG: hypothetical protein BWY85_02332 [Firmicutes bacterium ADurb.Bin506]
MPGKLRLGTTKSRAPSGVLRTNNGVCISRKPWSDRQLRTAIAATCRTCRFR